MESEKQEERAERQRQCRAIVRHVPNLKLRAAGKEPELAASNLECGGVRQRDLQVSTVNVKREDHTLPRCAIHIGEERKKIGEPKTKSFAAGTRSN